MWFATGCLSPFFARPVLIWNPGVVPFTGLIKGGQAGSIIREFVRLLMGSSKSFLCSIYYFLLRAVELFVYVQSVNAGLMKTGALGGHNYVSPPSPPSTDYTLCMDSYCPYDCHQVY